MVNAAAVAAGSLRCAGDVIGLTNPGAFAIGDTIYAGPELAFPPIPSFSPELFAYMRCAPNQKKAFNKGIEGLLGEGAVQVQRQVQRLTVCSGTLHS